jgi:ribosomal subunit interface protein
MMHIRITGKQIVIGEALPHRVREKVSTAVEKLFDRDAETNVTFTKERTGFRADCTVHLSSGRTIQAHGAGPGAQRALDVATDHLKTQLRRYTKRLKNHHDRGGQQSSSDPH